MKVVIQRVSEARVESDGQTTGQIDSGLLVLAGFEEADEQDDLEWIAQKIVAMRIFEDEQGKMNLDITQAGGRLLVVSQFTLHASTRKGNRPSFIKAARPEKAKALYDSFVLRLQQLTHQPTATGVFGAMMQVHLINHGPVTIVMDSKQKE